MRCLGFKDEIGSSLDMRIDKLDFFCSGFVKSSSERPQGVWVELWVVGVLMFESADFEWVESSRRTNFSLGAFLHDLLEEIW